jgi:cation:H+ antiporter
MNSLFALSLLIGGLGILWAGAELLVAAAVSLAFKLKVSPMVIGLTIVAMGTSAPEAAAGLSAAVRGAADVAVGDVYGSNIANLALVGGISAMILPIRIAGSAGRRELPILMLVTMLILAVVWDANISLAEGVFLLAVFAAFLLAVVYFASGEDNSSLQKPPARFKIESTVKAVLGITAGLAALALGAEGTVRGAVFLGGRFGLSDAVIGLTIIAVGTSLPELATCVVASARGSSDITVGNLVGSNVFNALLVLGGAGLVRPLAISPRLAAGPDYWVLLAVTAIFTAIALLAGRISRAWGGVLLALYAAYMVYLFGA